MSHLYSKSQSLLKLSLKFSDPENLVGTIRPPRGQNWQYSHFNVFFSTIYSKAFIAICLLSCVLGNEYVHLEGY